MPPVESAVIGIEEQPQSPALADKDSGICENKPDKEVTSNSEEPASHEDPPETSQKRKRKRESSPYVVIILTSTVIWYFQGTPPEF